VGVDSERGRRCARFCVGKFLSKSHKIKLNNGKNTKNDPKMKPSFHSNVYMILACGVYLKKDSHMHWG